MRFKGRRCGPCSEGVERMGDRGARERAGGTRYTVRPTGIQIADTRDG